MTYLGPSKIAGGDSSPSPTPEKVASSEPSPSQPNSQVVDPQPKPDPAPLAATGAEGTPQVYTPDLKFKFAKEEKSLPEYLKDAIKNAETEKELKEVYQRALGFDHSRPKFQEMQKNFSELQQQHEGLLGGLEELRSYVQSDDFDSYFHRTNIPKEKVLQWAIRELQYSQLPPEQQRVLEDRRRAQWEARDARRLADSGQEQTQRQIQEIVQRSLEVALERADIAAYQEAFDSAPGRKPGSFLEEVKLRGNMAYQSTGGQVVPPELVIREVMGLFGPQGPAAGATAPQQKPAPNVIPNVGGAGSASPVGNRPKKIADFKKFRQTTMQ